MEIFLYVILIIGMIVLCKFLSDQKIKKEKLIKKSSNIDSDEKVNNVENFPYQKNKKLFSPAERSFLGVLDMAIDNKAMICGKVRMADVITPEKGLSRGEWQTAFNKTSRKHFDFVLCNKGNLEIICAIELDDKSHNSKSREKRDKFLDRACDAAGIPLVHIPAKKGYVLEDIKEILSPHMKAA